MQGLPLKLKRQLLAAGAAMFECHEQTVKYCEMELSNDTRQQLLLCVLQLAVLEARSKNWGRAVPTVKGRSQSAPRGAPRRQVPPSRSAPAAVCASSDPVHSQVIILPQACTWNITLAEDKGANCPMLDFGCVRRQARGVHQTFDNLSKD